MESKRLKSITPTIWREKGWGKSVVEVLSKELQKEFPGVQGFSTRNLRLMRSFYIEYSQNTILPSIMAKTEKPDMHPTGAEIQKANLHPAGAEIHGASLPPLLAEIGWKKNVVIMDILERIATLQKKRGWSGYRLAKEAGIPQSTLSNLYKRKNSPTISTLEAVCRALGISLSQFFAGAREAYALTDEQKWLLDR
ncbi:MAG: DUF1016 N-terminal domain-containing protein [Clostridiales Family XIII bacterium]|jgi:DNA-binding phage protein|nr:DUF1016 N-terminal domain-containing protein [Clostridiales Family XIII bacterium]